MLSLQGHQWIQISLLITLLTLSSVLLPRCLFHGDFWFWELFQSGNRSCGALCVGAGGCGTPSLQTELTGSVLCLSHLPAAAQPRLSASSEVQGATVTRKVPDKQGRGSLRASGTATSECPSPFSRTRLWEPPEASSSITQSRAPAPKAPPCVVPHPGSGFGALWANY